MPHPHRSRTATSLYADASTAVLDRGLDLDSHDIALKSIANTHATAETTSSTSQAQPDTAAGAPEASTQTPRLPPLRPPLPPEGMQTLLSSCSRISSILLGLSSAVRDASPTSDDTRAGGGDGVPLKPSGADQSGPTEAMGTSARPGAPEAGSQVPAAGRGSAAGQDAGARSREDPASEVPPPSPSGASHEETSASWPASGGDAAADGMRGRHAPGSRSEGSGADGGGGGGAASGGQENAHAPGGPVGTFARIQGACCRQHGLSPQARLLLSGGAPRVPRGWQVRITAARHWCDMHDATHFKMPHTARCHTRLLWRSRCRTMPLGDRAVWKAGMTRQ